MPRLPNLSGKDVIKALARIGFTPIRQKGSHVILYKQTVEGKRAVVVPLHKEIDRGTLLEIIRQSGLKKEQFIELLS